MSIDGEEGPGSLENIGSEADDPESPPPPDDGPGSLGANGDNAAALAPPPWSRRLTARPPAIAAPATSRCVLIVPTPSREGYKCHLSQRCDQAVNPLSERDR